MTFATATSLRSEVDKEIGTLDLFRPENLAEKDKFALRIKNDSLLRQTQKKLSKGTAKNPITVVVESKNQGGFLTKVLIRNHEITSDQPQGFNGQNQGPKPSELVLAALAACQETTYRIYAEDMGITINEISVELTGSQDLRGFMALSEEVPAGFTGISGKVFIQSEASKSDLELLQKRVDKYCPVLDDLKRPVDVSLTVEKLIQEAK